MYPVHRKPVSLRISVFIYGLMVQVYPLSFRRAYGQPMLQLFQDRCHMALQQNRLLGIPVLWANTLVDFLLSVIEQYTNRGTMNTKSNWIKISGWFLAISSLFIVVGFAASSRPIYNVYNLASKSFDRVLNVAAMPLLVAGFLSLTLGILGLLNNFKQRINPLGKFGLILSLLGGITTTVGIIGVSVSDGSPWWELLMLGMLALFIGTGFFGVNCLRARLFSRWNFLPLMVSLPFVILFVGSLGLNSSLGLPLDIPEILNIIFLVVSFGGLALIGIQLSKDSDRSQSTSS